MNSEKVVALIKKRVNCLKKIEKIKSMIKTFKEDLKSYKKERDELDIYIDREIDK